VQAFQNSLIEGITNFHHSFLDLNYLKNKIQKRLIQTSFKGLMINKNEKKSLKMQKLLDDFLNKKEFLRKARIFNSISKVAKAHKKWIKAVQNELQKFKKM